VNVRVKICGITRVEDALAAAEAGVDAIGLVFVERSQRAVDLGAAAAICRALPPFVQRVGLFMDADADAVRQTLAAVPLNWLQFHGEESQGFCRQFQRPWIKALAMGAAHPPDPAAYGQADALLLDSHGGGKLGGSGQQFDWGRVPDLPRPWILAGGLDPANVARAIAQLRPDAVDVSSGVEVAPGIKDVNLINEFMKAIRHG
jgi:phosphoribosylanthranilate isomerase